MNMRTCNVSISLEYRSHTGEWMTYPISPEQFFWSDPDEPSEVWGFCSAWEMDEPIRLLPEEMHTTSQVRLVLTNQESREYQKCVYHHWAGASNYSCLVTEGSDASVTRCELIHVSSMPHLENGSQCLRIDLTTEDPSVTMNLLMYGKGGDEFTIDLSKHPK